MTRGDGGEPRMNADEDADDENGLPSVGLTGADTAGASSVDRLLDFLDDALDENANRADAPGGDTLPGLVRNPVPIRERGCVRGCGRAADGRGDFCLACRAWVLGDTDIDPLHQHRPRDEVIEVRKRSDILHSSVFNLLRRRPHEGQ